MEERAKNNERIVALTAKLETLTSANEKLTQQVTKLTADLTELKNRTRGAEEQRQTGGRRRY